MQDPLNTETLLANPSPAKILDVLGTEGSPSYKYTPLPVTVRVRRGELRIPSACLNSTVSVSADWTLVRWPLHRKYPTGLNHER